MANTNNPTGGKAFNTLSASSFNGETNKYYIPESDNTDVFIGDFVRIVSDSSENGLPVCVKANPGSTLVGVVTGVNTRRPGEAAIYRKAGEARILDVADDPYVEFEIQLSGDWDPTYIGKNADFILNGGNTSTGLSGTQLDVTTITDGPAQLKILGIVQREKNLPDIHVKVRCIIAEHAFKDIAIGVNSPFTRVGTTIIPQNIGDDLNMGTGDITATNANFTGKLTVAGLIDPTGMVLDPQASPPTTVDGSFYYDSVLGSFRFRENGNWHTVGGNVPKGVINVPADFPVPAAVHEGDLYLIGSDVTDNDPTKTNTGQSFKAGDEIFWNGTSWTEIGSSAIWEIAFGTPNYVTRPSPTLWANIGSDTDRINSIFTQEIYSRDLILSSSSFARFFEVTASDSPTGNNAIILDRARGSVSAPTALQDGDLMMNFNIQGHDGTTYFNSAARMQVYVAGPVSPGVVPGKFATYIGDGAGVSTETWTLNLVSGHTLNLPDNKPAAFTITEASNNYMTFDTTNAIEKVKLHKPVGIDNLGTVSGSGGINITNRLEMGANDINCGDIGCLSLSSTGQTQTRTFKLAPVATTTLNAASTISISNSLTRISGNGTPVTMTSTPTMQSGGDGGIMVLVGDDNVNTVTLQDDSILFGSDLIMGGVNVTLAKGDTISFQYDSGDGKWYEISRSVSVNPVLSPFERTGTVISPINPGDTLDLGATGELKVKTMSVSGSGGININNRIEMGTNDLTCGDITSLTLTVSEGVNIGTYSNVATTSADIETKRARGTLSVPLSVQSGDVLSEWQAQGYHTSSGFEDAAFIKMLVDGAPAANDMPGRIEFWTTPSGSDVSVKRAEIINDGTLNLITGNLASETGTLNVLDNIDMGTKDLDCGDINCLSINTSGGIASCGNLTTNGRIRHKLTASAVDYNPSTTTNDYIITITDTSVPRSVIISSEDVASGSPTQPRIFIIKDVSGGAATNNITVSLESGNIDGAANYVINGNYNSIKLYVDGTNAWII